MAVAQRPLLLSTLRQHLADNARLLGSARHDWDYVRYVCAGSRRGVPVPRAHAQPTAAGQARRVMNGRVCASVRAQGGLGGSRNGALKGASEETLGQHLARADPCPRGLRQRRGRGKLSGGDVGL